MSRQRNAIDQIEWMRNLLAFMVVGAFILGGALMFIFAIPEQNKELISYMTGQLSGMALMALGFYFIDKVGQAALDAKRSENTGKLADLASRAIGGTSEAGEAAEETAQAAVEKAGGMGKP
jgi:hypothetical protein